MKINKTLLKVIAALAVAAVVLVALFYGLKRFEKGLDRDLKDAPAAAFSASPEEDQRVYFGGQWYAPKEGLTTVLLLGIDDLGPAEDSGSYNNSGQADFIGLLLFDDQGKTVTLLHLNRDTMATIPVLGVDGSVAGTMTGQLALAHTYGSGLADSCENTVAAVSDFLYGVNIDSYISVNMDAVAKLSDLVGGVPVEIKDDFSSIDGSLVKGKTVSLTGAQALTFVRARGSMADSGNLARMDRQRQYLTALAEKMSEKAKSDENFALEAYNAIGDYMVSNGTIDQFGDWTARFAEYSLTAIVSPQGEAVSGDKFMEFTADEQALKEMVIDLFYVRETA